VYRLLNLVIMKTKLLLSLILSFSFCLLSSQVPKGFNYQAIARDALGNPIVSKTIKVMLSVLSDTTGFYATGSGNYIWEEEQSNITTNAFGLFSLVLGNPSATPVTAHCKVASFSAIDWAKGPLYVGIKIANPTSYVIMGSARLWTVPYSMVTDSTKALLKGSKLSVISSDDGTTDALFEVKRKDGQTVFAVYPNAVNVYVPRTAKGTKGGFAIGGFDAVKGGLPEQDYFRVTPDSVRIYIDKTPNVTAKGGTKGGFAIGGFDQAKSTVKQDLFTVSNDSVRIYLDANPAAGKGGTKGGFAIGGFDQAKGTNVSFLNVSTDTTAIINPSQNRILWYPSKNAFLTGKIIIENKDSVGLNSFSTGYLSRARGRYSQAMGYKTIARGDYSTAIGKNAIASNKNSYALGDSASATGLSSYAFGTYARASGNMSFALGSVGVDSTGKKTGQTIASGYGAFAIGFGSVASNQGAFTLGVGDTASGLFSTAIGYLTSSKGVFSTTMGAGTIVEPAGWNALAAGILTKAGNWAAVAFGDKSYASGHTSFATGFKTIASGHLSSSFGEQTVAQSKWSVVIGAYNVIAGDPLIAYPTDPIFVIGNGTGPATANRSNAMTVYKNGNCDLAGYMNLRKNSTGGALYVNGSEALWFDGTYYSWGYGGTYNVFADKVSVGTTANPGSYSLYVSGSAWSTGTWGGSDMRWKKNITPLGNILEKVSLLNSVSFEWRKDEYPDINFDSGVQIGLVAQDVEKIFPELVRTDNNGFKAVAYDKLSVILLEGLKEQQKEIDSQNRDNQQLKSELKSLREEIDKIKTLLSDSMEK
jgi:hypothetical protein